jgi:hypothetical protein
MTAAVEAFMRKHSGRIMLSLLATLLLAGGTVGSAAAEVNVNVNLGPPPVAVAQPPAVVLVPGSRVYFVPEVNYDVFFYNGYWWSPRGDRWYRARDYSGPWRPIPARIVPPPVHRVPRDYRRVYMHERHIPYGQWRREHNPGRHRGWDGRGGRGEHRGRGEHGHGEHGEHGDRGRHGGRD